jgi:hypothetical protein
MSLNLADEVSLSYYARSFNMPSNLYFTSPPKEGWNQLILGPMASMLTITPPRQLSCVSYMFNIEVEVCANINHTNKTTRMNLADTS